MIVGYLAFPPIAPLNLALMAAHTQVYTCPVFYRIITPYIGYLGNGPFNEKLAFIWTPSQNQLFPLYTLLIKPNFPPRPAFQAKLKPKFTPQKPSLIIRSLTLI